MRQEFTILCHPGSNWLIGVAVHESVSELREFRRTKLKAPTDTSVAFCHQHSYQMAHKLGRIADIHITKQSPRSHLFHEACHAATHFGNLLRLNLHCVHGDEILADTMEFVLTGLERCYRDAKCKRPLKKSP